LASAECDPLLGLDRPREHANYRSTISARRIVLAVFGYTARVTAGPQRRGLGALFAVLTLAFAAIAVSAARASVWPVALAAAALAVWLATLAAGALRLR